MGARKRPKAGWWLLPLIALFATILDQMAKRLVTANLGPYQAWAPIRSLSGWFQIHHVANSGAAFGLFRNGGTVLAAISIAVSLLILFYHRHLEDGQWLVRFSLGLQLGGAMGNLVDRLRLGYVTDFLDVHMLPVFNLADVAIVCGVVLLVLVLLREDRGERKVAATVEETSGAADASSP